MGVVYDYHWYRQNPDGTWSHKLGNTNVVNTDASGEIIYDPEAANYANSFYYTFNQAIKSWNIYGNEDLVINENLYPTVLLNLNNTDSTLKRVNIEIIDHSEEYIKSILSNVFDSFSNEDAVVTVTYTNAEETDCVIDYTYLHNGFLTKSGYSLIVCDEKIVYIRDNTIVLMSDVYLYSVSPAPLVTQQVVDNAYFMAAEELYALNDNYEVYEQRGEKFYDVEAGKYFYRVMTTYITQYDTYGVICTLYEL